LAREHRDAQTELTLAASDSLYWGYAGHLEEIADVLTALTSRRVEAGPTAPVMLAILAAIARSHDDPASALPDLVALSEALVALGFAQEGGLMSHLAAQTALDVYDPQAALEQCGIRSELARFPGVHADLTAMAATAGRSLGHAAAENDAHEALSAMLELDYVRGVPAVLTTLGGLALDAESPSEATRLLAAADALHTRIDHRRSPATQRRFDADVDRARELLGDEFETIWAEGAALEWRDAAAYARRARGERKRPSFGWESLTPTERQCAELAAEGLTNPEIAERMFIGRGTVKTHLARTFTKLDVRNRTELAAVVLERADVVDPSNR
jgi:DNA-binding CsgD family transcriptional regulator